MQSICFRLHDVREPIRHQCSESNHVQNYYTGQHIYMCEYRYEMINYCI